MAEQEKEEKQSKGKSAVSLEELQAIVNAAVTAALQQSNASGKDIAEALLEARKPYVDPKQKLNEESMRLSMREQAALTKAQTEHDQALCPHKKGANALSSRMDNQDSSFVKHILDSSEVIGICTNCTKVISSLNPQDIHYFQDRGTNITSMAGRRTFADPLRVQRARLGLDQKEIFAEEELPATTA